MAELQLDLASNWDRIDDIYEMIDRAYILGIKFVKLQLFSPKQVRDVYWKHIIYEYTARKLLWYAERRRINLYFTPCYPEAVDLCKRMEVKYYKIRYKDRNNADIFEKMSNVTEPIFISCHDPKDTLYYGMKNAIFLWCSCKYPSDMDDYNIFEALAKCQGISDHTPNLDFFLKFEGYFKYWEIHACLDDSAIERKWSKTFEEISGVLI